MIFDLEMLNSLSRPGFLHRARCKGFCFELLTFHLDEFQPGGLAAGPVEEAETHPSLPWGVSPFAGSRSISIRGSVCVCVCVCVCVNFFSGAAMTLRHPWPSFAAHLAQFPVLMQIFLYFWISWFVFQRESNMCHILTKALKGIFNVLLIHYEFLFQVGILNTTCYFLGCGFHCKNR